MTVNILESIKNELININENIEENHHGGLQIAIDIILEHIDKLNSHNHRTMSIFAYIKADTFFKDYLPNIKSYKHKIRGKNGRGNPIEFSTEEKQQIKKALSKLFKELERSIK